MIKVIGGNEETSEYNSARILGNLINEAWPFVGDTTNTKYEIHIIPSAQAYGRIVRDIDILVLGRFKDKIECFLPRNIKKSFYIKNVCLCIEIKSHKDNCEIKGNKLYVKYNSKTCDVSIQSEKQKYSLLKTFEINGITPPYIINLIWLTKRYQALNLVDKNNHTNIVTAVDNWYKFLETLVDTNIDWVEKNNRNIQSFYHDEDFDRAISLFVKSSDLCKPENYGANFNILSDSSFDIFQEILELESKDIADARDFYTERLNKQFKFLTSVLWEAFNDLKIKNGQSVFYIHKAADSHLAKLRPCFWVCATNSENNDYAEHVQLTLHIGWGSMYAEKNSFKRNPHLAFKIAFFNKFNITRLDRVKKQILQKTDEFRRIISDLHEKDSKYVFYRTFSSAKDDEVLSLEEVLDPIYFETILEDILGYDTSRPVPRSTEFAKRIDWCDELRQKVCRKTSFIHLVRMEFEKLMPLYKFYTN